MVDLCAECGDITHYATDAIVNAANRALTPGGGVCGAIHRAAGPDLARAAEPLGPIDTGEARLTAGFDLPAAFVIHAVGPVWQGGTADEDRLLARAYAASLGLAAERGLATIAFPAISCGVFGYPVTRGTAVAVGAVRAWLAGPGATASVQRVVFVCADTAVRAGFDAALAATDH
ncbi:hypothetical protein CCR80_07405 [Rhodothalassium salexigens]|uniref:macro domain-containing protein n=1 Tax=Rhodothalassium salexigens TaxID=1086 RepID=UPI001913442D|nr:macro domain-containing protein [Rhodothalassium salexigens]MBK5920858.1 hypothetical protein [Rhodothalassium salexigens]